jgi:hypothetical protein
VSWLTRLEQGRANRGSASVRDGLANSLRLSPTERTHLFNLAGVALTPEAAPTGAGPDPRHRRLVDGLDPNPAYLLDHHWDLVVWNRSEEELFPLLGTVGRHPNLLRLFLDRRELRTVIDDWPLEVTRLTRQFRAHVTNHPGEELDRLARELRAEHREFAEAWDRHDVAPLTPHVRVINHLRGQRPFDQHRLELPDHPGWLLVLFVPVDGPPAHSAGLGRPEVGDCDGEQR